MTENSREPVVHKSIVVRRAAADAFRLWTEQIHGWWPPRHSRSGDPAIDIVLEGQVGGRFYERASNGQEYDWGAVIAWDPPRHLSFTWFMGSGPERPTRVDVHFIPLNAAETRVAVRHVGPELIGELWWQVVARYRAAWDVVLPAFGGFGEPQT